MKSKGIKKILISIIIFLITILFLNSNGIINNTRHVQKEMSETTQVSQLNSQIDTLNTEHDAYKKYIAESKAQIAQAITTQGVETSNTASFETMVTNISKIKSENSSVYYVSLSNGDTVPIPRGFYYVGGTIASGLVISDEPSDKEKYVGYTDVPTGVAYNSDGTVNETNSTLKGNQFVWIPCSYTNYVKTDFGSNYYNTNWAREITSQEDYQVEKYGGFYVGRYEAGLGNSGISNNIKTGGVSVSKSAFASWHSDVFNLDGTNLTSTSKPTSKAGDIPWYHADYYTAAEISKRMYANNSSVKSGLLTGTMWDIMVKYMTTEAEYKGTNGTAWGNYANQNLTDCTGMYCNVTSGGVTSAWETNTARTNAKRGSNAYVLLSTGASASTKRKNIYDVAGNLWEWTQESAWRNGLTISNTDRDYNQYVLRGGSFFSAYSSDPACYRYGLSSGNTNTDSGFRVALYIK